VSGSWRGRALACALVAAAFACLLAGSASAKTKWLCRPGLAHNPCAVSLKSTVFSATGTKLGVVNPKPVKKPKIDCFYVYPTVSDQKTLQANLRVDPEERSIALFQAARYSQYCRVFAPMYRQLTISGITASPTDAIKGIKGAYKDVVAAWKDYLAHFNHGRGVILIGHSQGSGHLTQLVRTQIDPKPKLRKRLVSALLLGGGVTVKIGKDIGGDFNHIPACHTANQLHCVIAWSTFDQPVPANSRFGRGAGPFAAIFGQPTTGVEPLCTNPATLDSRPGILLPIEPTKPFAPGTSIALAISLLKLPLPSAATPWIEIPNAYSAQCSHADGASVLQITPINGAPVPQPSPDPTWGLHLLDANIGLGNLLDIVKSEARAYAK
jgi:pimeloyl-ACP methyl ester carboxylesterase